MTLAISCFVIIQFKDEISEKYFNAALAAIALTCNLFTWLESAAGFCVEAASCTIMSLLSTSERKSVKNVSYRIDKIEGVDGEERK